MVQENASRRRGVSITLRNLGIGVPRVSVHPNYNAAPCIHYRTVGSTGGLMARLKRACPFVNGRFARDTSLNRQFECAGE
jgi:hypothetical protein